MPRRDEALPPAAVDCSADCVETGGFQASVAPASGVVPLDAELSDTNAPLAADARGELGGLPDETVPLAADAAMATAEPPAVTELVTDSAPALLAESEESLVATGPDLAIAGTASAEPPANDTALVEVGVSEEGESSAAELQPTAPAAGPNPVATDTPTESTIPQHIARIGERYAEVPTAAPAVSVRSATERPATQTDRPALVESTVAVGLGETAASGVIVQDDELVAIRLGELVSLLEDRLDHPLYVWLSSSTAASKFVTAQTLAAAGIRTRYDPERRQLVISTGGE